jgi:DnaJ-class molecular chaperone
LTAQARAYREHQHVRALCVACGGSGLCEHGKVRQDCKDCGGSQVCKHKTLKRILRVLQQDLSSRQEALGVH